MPLRELENAAGARVSMGLPPAPARWRQVGDAGLLAWTPTFTPGFHDTNRLGESTLDPKPAP